MVRLGFRLDLKSSRCHAACPLCESYVNYYPDRIHAYDSSRGPRLNVHFSRYNPCPVVVLQESQCQTLPSPGVAGHEHGGLAGLVRVREPRRTEPVLQTGVGESAPAVGRVAETLPRPAPPSPSPSPGREQAQGHRRVVVGVAAGGKHARRCRTGRERRVPSAAIARQEETSSSSPSPPPEQTDQQILNNA